MWVGDQYFLYNAIARTGFVYLACGTLAHVSFFATFASGGERGGGRRSPDAFRKKRRRA